MKKIITLLIAFLTMTSISMAQNSRSSNSNNTNPRVDRKVAITTESGLKTMAGTGINVSYYPIPKLAIDGGVGLGLQGAKFGARARYLFLDQAFSPILGLGFNMSPTEIGLDRLERFGVDNPQVFQVDHDFDETTPTVEVLVDVKLNRSYYGQIVTGLDWVSPGGFVVAFNLGYRISLNRTIDSVIEYEGDSFDIVDQYADRIINNVLPIFGSGLSTSLHLGYAF